MLVQPIKDIWPGACIKYVQYIYIYIHTYRYNYATFELSYAKEIITTHYIKCLLKGHDLKTLGKWCCSRNKFWIKFMPHLITIQKVFHPKAPKHLFKYYAYNITQFTTRHHLCLAHRQWWNLSSGNSRCIPNNTYINSRASGLKS